MKKCRQKAFEVVIQGVESSESETESFTQLQNIPSQSFQPGPSPEIGLLRDLIDLKFKKLEGQIELVEAKQELQKKLPSDHNSTAEDEKIKEVIRKNKKDSDEKFSTLFTQFAGN